MLLTDSNAPADSHDNQFDTTIVYGEGGTPTSSKFFPLGVDGVGTSTNEGKVTWQKETVSDAYMSGHVLGGAVDESDRESIITPPMSVISDTDAEVCIHKYYERYLLLITVPRPCARYWQNTLFDLVIA